MVVLIALDIAIFHDTEAYLMCPEYLGPDIPSKPFQGRAVDTPQATLKPFRLGNILLQFAQYFLWK